MDNIFKIRWILSVEDEEARSIKFKWFVSTKNLIEIGGGETLSFLISVVILIV